MSDSHWNHRIVKHKDGGYGIHEVYYYGKADETIWGYTVDAVAPYGETLEELKIELERFMRALQHPILEQADLDRLVDKSAPLHADVA